MTTAAAPPSSHVRVIVRLRPLQPSEAGPRCAAPAEGAASPSVAFAYSSEGGGADPSQPPTTTATLPFDAVLGEGASQADAFASVEDVVDGVLAGRSGSIIAYGQTGSGKTHTLFGSPGAEDGIIARAVARLGAGLAKAAAAAAAAAAQAASPLGPATPGAAAAAAATSPPHSPASASPSVTVSVVEVYCDRVYCLLSPGRPEVTITAGGHGDGGCVGLAGAAAVGVASAPALSALIAAGAASRAVGSTAANARSSRSHCLVFVRVALHPAHPPAVLALADLAGSERATKAGTAAAGGAVFGEGRSINQSLSALGNVVSALATALPAAGGEPGSVVVGGGAGGGASIAPHISYRASKLTRLLQGVLGGAAATAFLVCASAAAADAKETLCALRFGARARGVAAGVVTDIGSTVPGVAGGGGAGGGAEAAAAARRAVAAAVADAAAARAALAGERAARAAEAAAAAATAAAFRAYKNAVLLVATGLAIGQAGALWAAWRDVRGA